ncbi:Isopenicillin N synthase-like, Fe(2+) 2OG dioxygenase domain [Dillenia turbinata]|uniref:Isopenicillin N synthase-like, Fe(2+) 2OG dioxygenase domain n=1 Tax=Dillenia turbinata TaxID=194707 RepID=A0AAN8W8J0_9MAGN
MATTFDNTTPTSYNRMKEVKEFDESKMGVKGLSDSGITSIPRFFVQPPELLSDLKRPSSKSSRYGIPVIDLSSMDSSPLRRQKIMEQVKEAASTFGFFQVINHGVAISVMDETIAAIKAFHEQPHDVKSRYYKRDEMKGVMFASNIDLYRSKAAAWHDSLSAWMAPEPPCTEEIPEVCRKEVVAWETHVTAVAEKVMELLSEGLGLEKDKFKELSFLGNRVFAGNYYPYCPQPDLTVGIVPHTDPGMVTVLLQNGVEGLQMKHGEEWVDVKPLHGGLIINMGDFLQIVSNGEYKSIQHRVLANSSKEPRISIVMFFNLAIWKGSGYYGPLPELLSPEKPAIYRDFTVQEFSDNFYNKGLDSKSLIDKIKI